MDGAFLCYGNRDSNPRLSGSGATERRPSKYPSGVGPEQPPLRGNPQSGQQGRVESRWSRFKTKAVYLQAVVRDNEIMESFDFLII